MRLLIAVGLSALSLYGQSVLTSPTIIRPKAAHGVGDYTATWPFGTSIETPEMLNLLFGSSASPVASTAPKVAIMSHASGAMDMSVAEMVIYVERTNGAASGLTVAAVPKTAGYNGDGIAAHVLMDRGTAVASASGFPLWLSCQLWNTYDMCSNEINTINESGADPPNQGNYAEPGMLNALGLIASGGKKSSSALYIGTQDIVNAQFQRGIDFQQGSIANYPVVLPNSKPIASRNAANTAIEWLMLLNTDNSLVFHAPAGGWVIFYSGSTTLGYFDDGGTLTVTGGFNPTLLTFPDTAAEKIRLFTSGAGAHYGISVAASDLRIYRDFNTSKISFGWGSAASFTSQAYIDNDELYIGSVNLTGNSSIVTVASHLSPSSGGTYDLGYDAVPIRWRKLWIGDIDASGTITGDVTGDLTGNASTATALAANPSDCTSGQFANAIDASGNLTCAAPSIPSSGYTTITFTDDEQEKIRFFTVGAGAHYGVSVASGDLRIYKNSSTSLISFGYGSATSFTSSAYIGNGKFYIGSLSLDGNSVITVANDLAPASDAAYDLGDPSGTIQWRDLRLSGTIYVGGNAGYTGIISCGAGQAIKSLVLYGGILNGASCGAP